MQWDWYRFLTHIGRHFVDFCCFFLTFFDTFWHFGRLSRVFDCFRGECALQCAALPARCKPWAGKALVTCLAATLMRFILFVCLYLICLFNYLCFLHIYPSIHPSLSICLSICLSIYLPIIAVFFAVLGCFGHFELKVQVLLKTPLGPWPRPFGSKERLSRCCLSRESWDMLGCILGCIWDVFGMYFCICLWGFWRLLWVTCHCQVVWLPRCWDPSVARCLACFV